MQSTGQTTRQASQPVHMSSSRSARTSGSFFLAIRASFYAGSPIEQATPAGTRRASPPAKQRGPEPMEFFSKLYDLLRHLGEDAKWQEMIQYIGVGNLYVVLFLIVFA